MRKKLTKADYRELESFAKSKYKVKSNLVFRKFSVEFTEENLVLWKTRSNEIVVSKGEKQVKRYTEKKLRVLKNKIELLKTKAEPEVIKAKEAEICELINKISEELTEQTKDVFSKLDRLLLSIGRDGNPRDIFEVPFSVKVEEDSLKLNPFNKILAARISNIDIFIENNGSINYQSEDNKHKLIIAQSLLSLLRDLEFCLENNALGFSMSTAFYRIETQINLSLGQLKENTQTIFSTNYSLEYIGDRIQKYQEKLDIIRKNAPDNILSFVKNIIKTKTKAIGDNLVNSEISNIEITNKELLDVIAVYLNEKDVLLKEDLMFCSLQEIQSLTSLRSLQNSEYARAIEIIASEKLIELLEKNKGNYNG